MSEILYRLEDHKIAELFNRDLEVFPKVVDQGLGDTLLVDLLLHQNSIFSEGHLIVGSLFPFLLLLDGTFFHTLLIA